MSSGSSINHFSESGASGIQISRFSSISVALLDPRSSRATSRLVVFGRFDTASISSKTLFTSLRSPKSSMNPVGSLVNSSIVPFFHLFHLATMSSNSLFASSSSSWTSSTFLLGNFSSLLAISVSSAFIRSRSFISFSSDVVIALCAV